MTQQNIITHKTIKARRTRQQILEAALELFQTRGFDATTMRQIARRAGVAVGATYYYFKTKEELVLGYYADSQQAAEARHQESLAQDWDFKRRMTEIVTHRLELLRPYRGFISVLARRIDPQHAISPFGAQTRELRQRAIQMISEAMAHSGLKPSRTLAPHLPALLWLYQMGIVFFWIHDASPAQQNTHRLLEVSLGVLLTAIRLSKNPLMRKTNKGLAQLMELIEETLS